MEGVSVATISSATFGSKIDCSWFTELWTAMVQMLKTKWLKEVLDIDWEVEVQ